MRQRFAVALILFAGCGVFRTFQNPEAKVVALYRDIQGASDLGTYLVKTGALSPDKAQIVHDTLQVAKAHVDKAANILNVAHSQGRTASKEEIAQAWSFTDLAIDALTLANDALTKAKAGKK